MVTINGIPLSGILFNQLSSIAVYEGSGIESDAIDLEFAGSGVFGRIALPEPGAEIRVGLGAGLFFRDFGVFVADECEVSNPPLTIRVRGLAKPQTATGGGLAPLHVQKSRSWDEDLSLGAIVEKIAGEAGLEPVVSDLVAGLLVGHLDQIDESDIALLTRIGSELDLLVKPVAARLFVGPRGSGVTASGKPMPAIPLLEADVSRWSVRRSAGEKVGAVVATYRDLVSAEEVEVKAGDAEPERRLRGVFIDAASAQAAAESELARAGRTSEALEVSMPGNALVTVESVVLPVFAAASAGRWVIAGCQHFLSGSGFTTSFSAERLAPQE
ncbi:phage late control D family protein [Salipiger sp. IMCC34102]|uniref:phage late control D family protein n=1 Tax=Salipiger sp. IMCC34102 TaxID=2510647 RepID=UPI0013EBBAF9|nr:late control protein D [Salipiger sp. IMCC34102]